MRVRAETHRALSKNERIRYQVGNATINKAFCFGTITNFCPSTNECFVVFDVPTLQPQWVTCIKGQIEILVGASEYANGHGKATSNIVSSSSSSSSSTLVVKSEPLAEEQHLEGEKLNNQAMGEEIQPYEDFDVNAKACHLCHLHCKYTDSVFTCTVCNLSCHTHCIPPSGLKPLNEPTQKSKVQAKCWNCTTCYGCGVNSWNASLINWNVRRVETTAAEKFILLCGACLHRYKHFQEFCTICYKLYSDSPRLVALAEEDDQRQSQSSHEDVHVKCEHVTEESESMHGKIKPLDDQSMVSVIVFLKFALKD